MGRDRAGGKEDDRNGNGLEIGSVHLLYVTQHGKGYPSGGNGNML